jgi:hypothetical protein
MHLQHDKGSSLILGRTTSSYRINQSNSKT